MTELSTAELERAYLIYQDVGSYRKAGKQLGVDEATVRRRVKAWERQGEPPAFEAPELPSEVATIDEIKERRRRIWARKANVHSSKHLIPIKINVDGPIGVALFGDLHIDSDGCNYPLLEAHTEIVRATEGMFAGAIGDLQDAWIGRLARLWANQGVTAREAWALVEDWVQSLDGKLIFVVEGNHDAWSVGVNGVSLVEWICSRQGTVSDGDGVRIALNLPSGDEIRINARHDMKGRSMWNPAHGGTKAAMMGWRDHVLIAGHTHESGYGVVKDPMTGLVSHVLRVASYKHVDEYAKREGFPDNCIFECPTLLIDPAEPDPRYRVTVEFNPFRAARVLTMMRAEWKARRKAA